MAVLKSKDGTELLVDCNCGCDNGMRFRIDKDDIDYYCFASYTNGKFYTEQAEGMWRKPSVLAKAISCWVPVHRFSFLIMD